MGYACHKLSAEYENGSTRQMGTFSTKEAAEKHLLSEEWKGETYLLEQVEGDQAGTVLMYEGEGCWTPLEMPESVKREYGLSLSL